MDFEAKLQEFGLSKKEARVYVALLELGESPASDIAQKSGVKRATTYVVLDSLKEMGLVSTYNQDGATQYLASNPNRLQKIVENKKEEWSQKSDELSSLLPELESLHNVDGNKPTIRFYEGEKGLLESYDEFLSRSQNSDESVKYFYSPEKVKDVISEKVKKRFIQLREKRGVGEQMLVSLSGEKGTDKDNVVVLDYSEFPISIDLEIYGDSVFISTLEKPLSAILIKNQSVANSLKTMFKLAQIGAQAENEDESKSETE